MPLRKRQSDPSYSPCDGEELRDRVGGIPWELSGQESACNARDMEPMSLGREEPLEKGMATHSSVFAWRVPWTEEPGGLQSMESQRIRHN